MAIRIHRSGETIYGAFASGDVHINLSPMQENLLLESGIAVRLTEEEIDIVLAGGGSGGGVDDDDIDPLPAGDSLQALPLTTATALPGTYAIAGVMCESAGTFASLLDSGAAAVGSYILGASSALNPGQTLLLPNDAQRLNISGAVWPVFTGSFSLLARPLD